MKYFESLNTKVIMLKEIILKCFVDSFVILGGQKIVQINKRIIINVATCFIVSGAFIITTQAVRDQPIKETPEAVKSQYIEYSDEKKEFIEKCEEKRRKSIERAEKYKDSDRPILDESVLLADPPTYKEQRIWDYYELTLSYEQSQAFAFENYATTEYNLIAAGTFKDNKTDGVIVNFYTRVATGEEGQYSIKVPGEGKITLVSVNKDKVTFKTEKGNEGILDLSDGKGRYKLK